MSRVDRLAAAVVDHARLVVVACLLTTLLFGAGLPALETDTSLEQFQTETPESEALAEADQQFGERDENTTSVQFVLRSENVLERESLLAGLRFQQELVEDERIGPTLVDEDPTAGVENAVATAVIRLEEADDLAERAADLEAEAAALDADIERLETALEEVASVQAEYEALNASAEAGEVDDEEYERRANALEASIEDAIANATTDLDPDQTRAFEDAATTIRIVEAERTDLEAQRADGELTEAEYAYRLDRLEENREDVLRDGSQWIFGEELRSLSREADALEAEREEIERLEQPPLDDQIAALEAADDDAIERAITTVFVEGGPGSAEALGLLPSSYEPGSLEADERLLVVTQSLDRGSGPPGERGDDVDDAQRALEQRVATLDVAGDPASDGNSTASVDESPHLVFGVALVEDEIDRAVGDNLRLVGPLALLFVVAALTLAYRDLLDVLLGFVGMLTVLVWTFGLTGWAGIPFTQVFVAIPVLLVGLSIDYAIHVVMRYREHRGGGTRVDGAFPAIGPAMTAAVAGVGLAFLWVTTTTAFGFLANFVSPLTPVRQFGLVSALGIGASLVVFGAMIPACKVELDDALERRGVDRRARAIGAREQVGRLLSIGTHAARRAPFVVLVCALVVTAGGVYGAAQVDTTFEEESFLTEEPPSWTTALGVDAGEYRMASTLAHLEDRYRSQEGQARILVTGDVTDGDTLQRIASAQAYAESSDVVYVFPGGTPDVQTPLSVMEATADESESFDASFQLADRTDDDVPDQNLLGLYDSLYEHNPDSASEVVYRTDEGEYAALLLTVGIDGGAESSEVAAEMRTVAGLAEGTVVAGGADTPDDDLTTAEDEPIADSSADHDGTLSAIATGEPLVTYALERTLLDSVVHSLLLALVAVVLALSTGFWLAGYGPTLGAITTLPAIVALGATLATMAVLGIPFNVLTGMVASLTIGLGIAYAIHLSLRYVRELEGAESTGELDSETPWRTLERTTSLTGAALAGSVVTTVVGFGVLIAAFVPVLQQFGLVTATTLFYAFLTSVLVLPTLLALWTRYLAPAPYRVDTLEFSRR